METTMRQVFRKIPVYTGDVSGVCSALYELGGMVVMHDPSGCNSTYNTHDEIRWYDQDSLIFISGLNEMEAIMGSDDDLIRDIVEAAGIYRPKFIAIANSPIPYVTGMDFEAISRLVEKETGIPTFYITTNGMHDYTCGAGLAFLHLADRFVKAPAEIPGRESAEEREIPSADNKIPAADKGAGSGLRCNILGMTPLDFACRTTISSLHARLEQNGMEIISCWAMDDTLADIEKSASADVNLVLASSGFHAAHYMYDKYGIPFVCGIPAKGAENIYFDAVRKAVKRGENRFPFRERLFGLKMPLDEPGPEKPVVCLIGEPVIMTSLAASLQLQAGAGTHVYGATEYADIFLGEEDAPLSGEEELETALRKVAEQAAGGVKVVADPYYRDVLPPGCSLIPLPHLAFSGRIHLKDIPDLIHTDICKCL